MHKVTVTIALRKNVEKPTTNYHDDLCRVFAHRDFTFDDVSEVEQIDITRIEAVNQLDILRRLSESIDYLATLLPL